MNQCMRQHASIIPATEIFFGGIRSITCLPDMCYGILLVLKGASWDNDLQDYREKLFPRRHSHESMHEATRVNYTSDGDFLWRYQINHMFTRYVLWNFVGTEGDWQDAGVSWKIGRAHV